MEKLIFWPPSLLESEKDNDAPAAPSELLKLNDRGVIPGSAEKGLKKTPPNTTSVVWSKGKA